MQSLWASFCYVFVVLFIFHTTAQFPANETGCLDNEFECTRSNSCLALVNRCDKVPDCLFSEDEEDCKAFQCSKTQFKCGNDFCISREYLCNFEDDCGDFSDEMDCQYRKCWPSEFRCDNQECIRPGMVCDGIPDCHDNSDELSCLPETCDDLKRIHNKTKCNGWPECEDHKDELNCDCDTSSGEFFRCPNTRCLRKSKICDGVCDCLGEKPCFDEINCERHYLTVNGYQICKVGSTISCKSTVNGETIERCISSEYICDGFNDCLNGNNNLSDEFGCNLSVDKGAEDSVLEAEGSFIHCSYPDRRKLPGKFVCDFQVDCLNGDDEINCDWEACKENEFQCNDGSCTSISSRCDAKIDCNDKSDEINCTGFICPDTGKNNAVGLRQCKNGQCISSALWCDFRADCSDGSDETDCVRPTTCGDDEFPCKSLNQCIPKSYQCYKDENPRSGCADQSHLKGCANFTCPEGTFKCKIGPCLKPTLLCDGKFDCLDFWMDEENCTHECFEVCTCIDITANCTGLGLQTIKNIDKMEDPYRKFYFANNNLSNELNANFTYNIRFAILLDLSNNSICSLTPGIFKDMQALKNFILQNNCITVLESQTFDGLANLNGLHLEGNHIQKIKEKAFYGLSSLPTLNLRLQGIEHIAEGAFRGLRKLSSLDLSQNKIQVLYQGTFQDLNKLTYLDLRGNLLRKIESHVFQRPELSIQVLLFDSFKFCCLAKNVPNCQPISDEFSTCEDLMSNFVLRVCVWVLGIIATLGNLLVIGWRITYKHKNKVHSFLITNLAIGDFFMGFYLLIIASVDTQYRGVYSVHDEEWRASKLCSLAGFLSTLSSELSVFTLTVVTLDRFLVIMFPFQRTRLEMNQIRWVMLGIWIAATFLSGLPLIYRDYFKNFYGRTGVCLALCITTDKNEGWKYSAFIFVFLNFLSFSVIAIGYIWMYSVAKTTRLAVCRNIESKRVEQVMARRMILIVATDAACWVPIIFLGILSLNGIAVPSQYLDLRFKSRTVRCLASGTYILRNILNTGVTVFTPCVALKTIIGFPYWVSITGITFISIICAVVGGLKAVILSDVIQGLIMIACSLAIIIQGSLDTGGVDQIFKANYDNGRFIFFNFNTDPTVRVTTLSALLGQLFMSLSIFGCQQNFVQRYCSMQSLKTVRRTLWTNVPVIAVLFSLSWIAGMVIFADYVNCDPLKLGYISKIDEIVPFYVEDKFTHIPGLLGVFMASLFNGALSLSVSNLNSMATVAWEDFLSKVPYFKKFTDKEQLLVIKSLGVLIGLLTMAVAFGVALLSGVIESSQLMTSATSGPLLGVFVLAMLFPGCNWKGAASGMIISHIITIWITFGSKLVDKGPNPMLPLSVDGCNNESFTGHVFPEYDATGIQGGIQWVNTTDIKNFYTDDTAKVSSASTEKDFLSQIYLITYMYYSLLGSAICIVFGLLISYLTGTSESDVYDEKLIHPVAFKLSRFFPGKPRKYLKDTIVLKKEEKKEETLSPDIKLRTVCEQNGTMTSEGEKTNSTYQNNIKIHASSNVETLPSKTNKR